MKKISHAAIGGMDSLGRCLTSPGALPEKRDRLVGMFYFMCHDDEAFPAQGAEFFEDVLDAYDVESLGSPDSPFYDHKWGTPFYWGKPLFGCYRALDEWVKRRHVEMLSLAGVDFIVIDSTNLRCFSEEATLIMKILDEGLKAGFNTPKVAFYTNTDSGERVRELYDRIYSKNIYPDTWLCFEGNPVIIGIADQQDPEMLDFFHFRGSQWPNSPLVSDPFPWIDFGEQLVYARSDGSESVMSVSVAQNSDPDTACFGSNYFYGSDGCHGRSFHDGKAHITEDSYKYGYNFAEQWKNAREKDPDIVFVTGWNEWVAGVWTGGENNRVAVFDCMTPEYSRDIEPMQGGFGDAYFLQLIDEVRKYKGIEKEDLSLPVHFENYTTALIQRDSKTSCGTIHDNSLRNVITSVEVKADGDALVFTAETRVAIDESDRIGDWMRLYLNAKKPDAFCYCFNLRTLSDGKTVAAVREDDRWVRIGTVDYKVDGNRISITIPKSMCPEGDELFFKWVDSRTHCRSGDDFYLYGSVAPLGRLYYKVKI